MHTLSAAGIRSLRIRAFQFRRYWHGPSTHTPKYRPRWADTEIPSPPTDWKGLVISELDQARARIAELEAAVADYREQIGTLRLQLDVLSSTDSQSGLPNLNGLQEVIAFAQSRLERGKEGFGIVSIAFENLRELGDTDPAGLTDALRHVGGIIRATVRDVDTVGRFDRDSFMVVMPELAEAGLDIVFHRLRSTLTVVPLRRADGEIAFDPAFAAVVCDKVSPASPVDLIGALRDLSTSASPAQPSIRSL